MPNDYYSYGGITRPMVVEALNDVYIKNIHFVPYKVNNSWHCRVTAKLHNISKQQQEIGLRVTIGEYLLEFGKISIQSEEHLQIEKVLECPMVEDYTLDLPKLYMLHGNLVQNDEVIDDFIDRVGFREVKVIGKDIIFGGKKVIIKGVNRHEDYAEFGCSIPLEAMYRDIEIIKSLGANCVRTCHYPNDERFLDLCDENGILVWEESHARGLNEKQMRHKNFDKQSEDCITEMIEHHINHPSIYVWGILNECVSNTEFGRSCYEKQFNLIRSLDSSRPVSYASLESCCK